MKSKRMEFHNKFLIVSAMLAVISWLSLGVVSFPMLAGTLGISTKAAATVVNLISAYSTVGYCSNSSLYIEKERCC
ncbi:membrane protein [Streptococcus pneumoniae]|nr:membrane protein [Streptococcus pneumoniae]